MIATDETFLSILLHPKAKGPLDPSTGKPIPNLHARIDDLIEKWHEDGETIIIPTPPLAEFLILAGKTVRSIWRRLAPTVPLKYDLLMKEPQLNWPQFKSALGHPVVRGEHKKAHGQSQL